MIERLASCVVAAAAALVALALVQTGGTLNSAVFRYALFGVLFAAGFLTIWEIVQGGFNKRR